MTPSGLRIPGAGEFGRETAIEFAQLAESRGIETVWVGESWGQSAIPLLTQILDHTSSIEACTGILNVYSRTPALVAMEAAALADVSDGRFRLGLGTSGQTVVEELHGVPFERPLRRTREYIELIQELLTGEDVQFDGELFQLSGFGLDTEAVDVPIYVAAMGDRNRQLVGEFADGWIPLLVPHTALDDAMDAVVRGTARADRSLDVVDVAPWIPTCISAENPDAAIEAVRSLIAFYVGAMGEYYADAVSRFGYSAEAARIRDGWEADTLEGAREGVSNEMVRAFGACGTPEAAAETLAAFEGAGADSPIAYVPTRWTSEEMVRTTISSL
jgi:alkanesulfonate monooxygenase SsuD/methylene tetrahydromethanopterin reductase-like flavin-dependent oxidoreductase (luciferase family)